MPKEVNTEIVFFRGLKGSGRLKSDFLKPEGLNRLSFLSFLFLQSISVCASD